MATVGFVAASALVVVGATPAVARKTSSPSHHQRAFTQPAENTTVNSVCQPKPNKPCPHTNNVWSGYVLSPESGHQFTTVSASWVQTAVTCPKSNAWALFWTGIDGWSQIGNATVEQGGSSAQCTGTGPPDYEAWWEMYPTNDVQTVFPISVRDHINAQVVFSSVDDSYTVTVSDVTSGHSFFVVCSVPDNSYTITVDGVTTGPTSFAATTSSAVLCPVSSPCMNGSAEWVVEAPGGNNGSLYPLAHFRPLVFKSAFAADNAGDSGPITTNGWLFSAIDLATVSGIEEANVMPLMKQGTSFRVVWSRGQGQ